MHALERADLEEGEVSDLFERLFSGGSGGQRFSYAADAERTALDDLLESNGFERLVVPSGDGRLAVQLALDAVGLAERHGTSRFLLMADNDALLPLAEALRKRQCEVVCLGAEGALAEGCDRSLEWGLSEASESPESSTAATAGSNGYESDSGRDSNPEDSSRDVDPFELLIEAISTVRQGLPGLMWGSVVLQTIQEQYPWFSQHNGGYESFEQLLESAQERGLITLERDSQADSYLITGFVEPAS